jgi:hypothetical protein
MIHSAYLFKAEFIMRLPPKDILQNPQRSFSDVYYPSASDEYGALPNAMMSADATAGDLATLG